VIWRRLLPALFFFCLTFLVAAYYSVYDVDPHHDGAIFKPALDVSNGMMLYRDTFSQYGALFTLITAAGLKVFGPYVLVLRILAAFFYGLIGAMLWLLGKRLLPRWLAALVVLFWLGVAGYIGGWFLAWSSIYALFFQLAAVYFLLRHQENEDDEWGAEKYWSQWLVLAGLMAALAFWCRQPTGVLTLGAMMVFSSMRRLRSLPDWRQAWFQVRTLMFGFVLGVLPILGWIVLNGALKDWYLQNFVFGSLFIKFFGHSDDIRYLLRHLFPFFNLGGYQPGSMLYGMLPVLNLAGLALLAGKMWRGETLVGGEAVAYAIGLLSLASWPQYYPFPDDGLHAYWAATPMMPMTAWLMWTGVEAARMRGWISAGLPAAGLVVAGLLLLFGARLAEVGKLARDNSRNDWVRIEQPKQLRGLVISPQLAARYQYISDTLAAYVSSHPQATVISAHRENLHITFSLNARNFHPLTQDSTAGAHWLIPELYPQYYQALNQYVNKYKPLVIARPGLLLPVGYREIEIIPSFGGRDETIHLFAPIESKRGGERDALLNTLPPQHRK
jgi:4-amino-4-deoxy-L-arabinose transferase-like glycosyltransferase